MIKIQEELLNCGIPLTTRGCSFCRRHDYKVYLFLYELGKHGIYYKCCNNCLNVEKIKSSATIIELSDKDIFYLKCLGKL